MHLVLGLFTSSLLQPVAMLPVLQICSSGDHKSPGIWQLKSLANSGFYKSDTQWHQSAWILSLDLKYQWTDKHQKLKYCNYTTESTMWSEVTSECHLPWPLLGDNKMFAHPVWKASVWSIPTLTPHQLEVYQDTAQFTNEAFYFECPISHRF